MLNESPFYLLWCFFWIDLRKTSVNWKFRIHLACVKLPFGTQAFIFETFFFFSGGEKKSPPFSKIDLQNAHNHSSDTWHKEYCDGEEVKVEKYNGFNQLQLPLKIYKTYDPVNTILGPS